MISAPNIARIVAGVILVSQAVVVFLLAQQDVAFEPITRVVLGAASVGLNTLALYLNVRMPGQSS